MAELNFTVSVNNEQVLRKLGEIQSEMRRTAQVAESSGTSIDQLAGKLRNLAMSAGAAFSAKELVTKIAQVRGEFQQLEMAFKTMLGSAEKANDLMAQLTRTAATTPFDLQGVANGAKMLLAYGVAADEVNDTLIRCGDVAAGLSIPLNDLVYLYGTTMTQGRMFTQDLRQFQGRGIPIAEELAKVLGTTTDKLGDMVTAGRVTSEVFQQAFNNMTSAGSRFGGLMEAQSQTITGQISNIEDAIDMMFNELGQKSEGAINTALSGVSYVVEHYERFGRILLSLVASYGAYKVAVMAATAAQGWATAAEALHYNWLLLVERAQKVLNATMLSNPYVLVAAAIGTVVTALVSMKTETELVQEATEEYDEAKQKAIEAEDEHRQKVEELIQIASDEATSTGTRRAALLSLEQQYPSIFAKYKTEYDLLKNIKKVKEEIAELDGKTSVKNTDNEISKVNKRIAELENLKKTQKLSKVDAYGDQETVIGLTEKQEAELKSLLARQQQLSRTKEKQNATSFLEDLSGLTDNQLKAKIAERRRLINDMKANGKKTGHIISGEKELRGYFTEAELEAQINAFVREQNERNAPRSSSSERQSDAKKRYEKAQKDFNDFLSSKTNNLTDAEYDEQYNKLKNELDEAKKDYNGKKADKSGGRTSKNNKADQEAEKRKKTREKLGQELVELQLKNDDDEIAAMQEGTEKRLRQIEADYNSRKAAIEKQRSEWVKENKEAGNAVGSDGLTDAQRAELEKSIRLSDEKRQKEKEDLEKETLRNELQAMSDYLQQYGTLQEQKYAIAALYAQKIKEVQESGDSEETKRWKIASLQKEQSSLTSKADAQSLAMGIDWSATFQGVGNVLKDIAKETLQKVEEYIKTDEFKSLSATDKKTYTDFRNQLRTEVGGQSSSALNFGIWGRIENDTKAYQKAVRDLRAKTELHKAAVASLEKANRDLANATDDEAKKMAQIAVDIAKTDVSITAAGVDEAQQKADDAKNNLSDSTTKAVNGLNNFTDALNEMSSGTLFGFANGLTKLFTSLKGGTDSASKGLSEIGGKAGGIIGAILSIIDTMADDPKQWTEDLFTKVSGALENLLSDLPDLSLEITKGVGNVLGSIVNGIAGIFGVDDLLGINGNEKWVTETIDKLNTRIDALRSSMDDLSKAMKEGTREETNKAYKEAMDNQQLINEAKLGIAKTQSRYWKRHRSFGYYWNPENGGGLSSSQIAWANQYVKSGFNGDIWSLTPDEMKKLLSNPEIVQAIKDTGKGGYGDKVLEALQSYADEAGKLAEYTEQWQESIAGVSFDTMKDNFVSALMDMNKDAKDFADDFKEMMQQALLKMALEKLFDEKLKPLYERYVTALSNGTLTELEKEEFQRQWDEASKEGIQIRDNLAEFTGYDKTQQEGDSGGFEAMSQETADELNGRFTMLQRAAESTRIDVLGILNKMDTSIAISTVRNTLLQEVVTIMNRSTSYLEDIAADARKMYVEFGEKFDTMNTKLKLIAG